MNAQAYMANKADAIYFKLDVMHVVLIAQRSRGTI